MPCAPHPRCTSLVCASAAGIPSQSLNFPAHVGRRLSKPKQVLAYIGHVCVLAAQPVPMSRAPLNPAPTPTPPDLLAQPGLAPSNAQPPLQQPINSSGLAAALASLNQSQLSNLAGLLGQGVWTGRRLVSRYNCASMASVSGLT